jgi:hypothetical protein
VWWRCGWWCWFFFCSGGEGGRGERGERASAGGRGDGFGDAKAGPAKQQQTLRFFFGRGGAGPIMPSPSSSSPASGGGRGGPKSSSSSWSSPWRAIALCSSSVRAVSYGFRLARARAQVPLPRAWLCERARARWLKWAMNERWLGTSVLVWLTRGGGGGGGGGAGAPRAPRQRRASSARARERERGARASQQTGSRNRPPLGRLHMKKKSRGRRRRRRGDGVVMCIGSRFCRCLQGRLCASYLTRGVAHAPKTRTQFSLSSLSSVSENPVFAVLSKGKETHIHTHAQANGGARLPPPPAPRRPRPS